MSDRFPARSNSVSKRYCTEKTRLIARRDAGDERTKDEEAWWVVGGGVGAVERREI